MAHEPKEKLFEFLQKNAITISLQMVGLIVVLLNLWLVNKLAPISSDIQLTTQRVAAIEDKIKSDVGREEFDQVLKRLDYISERVDQLLFERRRQ